MKLLQKIFPCLLNKKTETEDRKLFILEKKYALENDLLSNMLKIILPHIFDATFCFENIVNNSVLTIQINFPRGHNYYVKILIHKNKDDYQLTKMSSSSVEGYISYDNFYDNLDLLIADFTQAILGRFKGYKNERRTENMMLKIISDHKIDLKMDTVDAQSDKKGIDIIVGLKNKRTRVKKLYFEVKSSETKKVRTSYFNNLIHLVIVNDNKSDEELYAEIWDIVKKFCIKNQIKYS